MVLTVEDIENALIKWAENWAAENSYRSDNLSDMMNTVLRPATVIKAERPAKEDV